jgi:hypothetical protein
MTKKTMTNEEVIRFHRDCILKLMGPSRSPNLQLSFEDQRLIKGHLDMIVQLAGAKAPLEELDLEL